MKYTVSMSSKKNKKRKNSTRSRRKKVFNISKIDRFKKFSGRKSKKKRSTKKGFLGIDKKKLKKFLYISIGVIFFLSCIAVLGVGIYLKNLRNSLPSPNELVERTSDQSTKIYDRNGELLYTVYGDQNREFVPIDEMPEHTK